ncbi:RNA polymerase sigma factor [Aquimarina sp. 2201CG14-23]|uniref:RNA polymerase sigma factor n=1 Tax=Aquimarina mycalae TaxID=3040073 RepID=UPI002477DA8B|nr:RNA polymerase sigma-70 factor [Aquimarina sp. 2201CG14-23]MDH7447383.1 RNA polymerase sigma-70 factor [Aquimarina sp. 2201CG14-23]
MTSSNDADKKLLTALKKGSKKAYTDIYVSYYERLCKYIFSLSRNLKESEDLVQETLLQLWTQRDSLKIHTSLKAYLYKSAYHKYIDFYRKNLKERTIVDALQQEAVIAFEDEDNSVKEERLRILKEAIELLPEKRKEIFVLNKLKNHRYKEVAVLLNISERTVESQIRKALIFIRERLKNTLTSIFFILYSDQDD